MEVGLVVVDLAFELSYILGDRLGRSVEVKSYSFDPEKGLLCIETEVEGVGLRQACVEVKACKGLSNEAKWVRCVSKTLMQSEKYLDELARQLA
ncbi:hypothetical protein Hbut_1473 [Hyperthermus butylicus DSM 5456]|uniref:Uncharacterized protein n=1 Tax=Hyperthermus butylicus (strain DSM 5456 / JCM 9403 / PLM1-5) TaxID=415426 RepID=A2BMT6_HYPBU|nr:hypothetical protein Hbut_1473 [Hyperthermus butylicus DSM 5456]